MKHDATPIFVYGKLIICPRCISKDSPPSTHSRMLISRLTCRRYAATVGPRDGCSNTLERIRRGAKRIIRSGKRSRLGTRGLESISHNGWWYVPARRPLRSSFWMRPRRRSTPIKFFPGAAGVFNKERGIAAAKLDFERLRFWKQFCQLHASTMEESSTTRFSGCVFKSSIVNRKSEMKNGRGGEIRTHDLLYPKQARYQATLRPDS